MKTCRKCGEEKPLAQFSKTAAHADGLRHWCKVCANNARRHRLLFVASATLERAVVEKGQ